MARRPHALTALAVAGALALAGCSSGPDEPDPPDPAVFCEDHAIVEANFASLPNDSLDALQDGVAELATDADGLADRAPAEVAEPARAVADGLRRVSDAVAAAATLEAAQAAAAAVVDQDAYRQASEAVTAWVGDNCASN